MTNRPPTRVRRVADLVAELAAQRGTEPTPPSDSPSPQATPEPLADRPRIVDDTSILGLSRISRSRLGSRLFVLFFVFVYAVILIQLVITLWQDTA